jgi:hypothetical protein
MTKLQAPLHQLLDEPISELQVQRIWRHARSPLSPRRRKRWQLLAAVVLTIALAVALLLRS